MQGACCVPGAGRCAAPATQCCPATPAAYRLAPHPGHPPMLLSHTRCCTGSASSHLSSSRPGVSTGGRGSTQAGSKLPGPGGSVPAAEPGASCCWTAAPACPLAAAAAAAVPFLPAPGASCCAPGGLLVLVLQAGAPGGGAPAAGAPAAAALDKQLEPRGWAALRQAGAGAVAAGPGGCASGCAAGSRTCGSTLHPALAAHRPTALGRGWGRAAHLALALRLPAAAPPPPAHTPGAHPAHSKAAPARSRQRHQRVPLWRLT
jgi:hypothetical protein